MLKTITADALAIGSAKRIALAQVIAGLIGRIARLSVVQQATSLANCSNRLIMDQPGTYRMTLEGVVVEIHDFCHRPQNDGWTEIRPLATPFGRWRICPGTCNGGGDVFIRQTDLDRLLTECDATDLPSTDALNYPVRQKYTRLKALRRINDTALPEAIGVFLC